MPVFWQQANTLLAPCARSNQLTLDAEDVYRLRHFGTPRAIQIADGMLRISIHEEGKVWRLELAGKLEGPWVAETEKAWSASLLPDQKIEIDLRELTSVDNDGRDLLAAFQRSGACFIVEGVWMTALLGDLTSRPCEGPVVQSSKKKLPRKPTSSDHESSK